MRLRHVAETAPDEAVESQDEWAEHRVEMEGEPVADPDDLAWADAVLFGTPTRFGSATSQLQAFIDTLGPLWQEGGLADKVYAGFTATQTEHGGQETTLLSLYTNFMHWGGIIVTPGYTDEVKFADGNPYGAGKVTGDSTELEDVRPRRDRPPRRTRPTRRRAPRELTTRRHNMWSRISEPPLHTVVDAAGSRRQPRRREARGNPV